MTKNASSRGMSYAAVFSVLAVVVAAEVPTVAQVTGYYRFPSVQGDRIVFTAEGDLWSGSVAGGAAHRLTTHPGEETFPVLSPDGAQVAFAATYEGAPEVYLMPVAGGRPQRLTWDGSSSTAPVAWTADGKIVYRTTRYSTLPNMQLMTVDPTTFARERVPLEQAADATFGPDGTVFFTRLPRQGSNSRWYKGGLAQTLWKWAPGTPNSVALTADWPGTSKNPIYHEGRVYFLSDRAQSGMNVWSMDPDGGDLVQHTFHQDWDIQEHALSGNAIVYRLGADLWRLDLLSGQTERIDLTLVTDLDQRRESWVDKPMAYLASAQLAPDGSRVVLTSRGQVFVAPTKAGRLVHVSRDSGVRHRYARFSADGKRLLTLSDASGEVEWWSLPIDGMGSARQISEGPAMLREPGIPSPDGRWIAHTDYDRRIWLVDLRSGATRQIATSSGQIASPDPAMAWSPDSQWLAFSAVGDLRMSGLWLYDVETGGVRHLTSDRYEDWRPAWSPDGSWLYFLSNRALVADGNVWGARAEQPGFQRQTLVFAHSMRRSAAWPYRAPDELHPAADSTAKATTQATGPIEPGALRQVPLERGEYAGLAANDKRLFVLEQVEGASASKLIALDLKHDAKPVTVLEGITAFELSTDGKKILVRKGETLFVIDATAGKDAKLDDAGVDLSGWTFAVDKADEWQQIFDDAWRMHRDYFYDPALHEVDWPAVRAKYAALVTRVGAREELADLQAQMVSELSLMHSSAGGGDTREGDDNILPASLGARFERDEPAGGFRVIAVYRADPDLPEDLAPLAKPDADVGAGDVILSVNGEPATGAPDIGALLRGLAGKPVRLRIRNAAGAERDVVATAISVRQEADLRYTDWEYGRRLQVEELGADSIGYVHLRAMSTSNMAEWMRDYYPVFNRQGLIVDVRNNNGGNIDSWVLGQLLRRAWMYWKGRAGSPYWNMQYAFRGHIVVLVNERTSSDGEAFAEGFKRLGLGSVIGTRTWGGEVWLSSGNRQVDGGIARAAEFGVYGPEGAWLVEGWGVEPDLVVDNDPRETFLGRDAQLEAAVAHLKRLMQEDPRPVPGPPPYPVVAPGVGYPVGR